jgi:predicted SAM-dependent methyltransferase
MKLNLGASDRHIDGYISVDIVPPADQIADLADPWPWATSSIDDVIALDVIEHIGDCDHTMHECASCSIYRPDHVNEVIRHPNGRIHFMNELHRVLRHSGPRRRLLSGSAALLPVLHELLPVFRVRFVRSQAAGQGLRHHRILHSPQPDGTALYGR